ncbi:hypothetical protein PV11_06926 [Exophiala sideris]|uniref:Zn(2)-C6 fungal-type domain-containing protein n=1 Tax=Exophiala sideris TaxID=1016849 RepID=A0A0D1YX27_9EURO|nr:hypothetical protein PV11_06926 [Exophiala sideris]
MSVPPSQNPPFSIPWPQGQLELRFDTSLETAAADASSSTSLALAPRGSTKHTSQACTSCRKRRRKCDGDQGMGKCSECIKHNFECVLDANTDRRRKMHREKARKDQQLLHRVLSTLRQRPGGKAESLMNLIREDAPLSSIEAHLTAPTSSGEETSAGPSGRKGSDQDDSGSNSPLERPEGVQLPLVETTWTSSSRVPSLNTLPNPHSSLPFGSGRRESSQMTQLPFVRTRLPGPQHLAFLNVETADVASPSQQPAFTGGPPGQDNYVDPGAVRTFGNLPMSSAIMANGWSRNVQQHQLDLIRKPQYNCELLLVDDQTKGDPLSQAALGFRDDARSLIAQGRSVRKILSMDGLQTEVFFRDRLPEDAHTVSNWACEFTKAWRGLLPANCLYASIWMISSVMRWMILPCRETWMLMPEMIRPLLDQFAIPHQKLFVDLCHFPQIRSSLLNYNRDFIKVLRFETFNCHWPYADEACVQGIDGAGLDVRSEFTPLFLAHISDTRNWSLHKDILTEFPELANQVPFHE